MAILPPREVNQPLIDWLTANGIDCNKVPWDCDPVLENNRVIIYDEYEFDVHGRIVRDEFDRPVIHEKRVRQTVPRVLS